MAARLFLLSVKKNADIFKDKLMDTKVYLAANGKGKDVQRFVKWSKRQKTDRWITYFSNQMGFPMRDVPYGDDSAWQPDKLCFNPIYTHTHAHTHLPCINSHTVQP